MKLIIDWLKEFVEIKESPQELSEIFTMLGAEVENIYGDVLDLEITPNRPDWLSVYGLARELAAFTNRSLKKLSNGDLAYQNQSKILNLQFENKNLVPRYSAIVFENVDIKPSSKIIQNRLKQMGINTHNNIVDITNYVMLELGIPLHAFDLDEITDHKMILRESKPGETLETLDEKTHLLPEGSLVIEDGKRLIDLMGIKGGENSGIKNSTNRILLQATVDEPKHIRMTSKKIGLSTEASYRFERGVDEQITLTALEHAKKLILESTGARILETVNIINKPGEKRIISLDPKKVSHLLGTKIEEKAILSSLTNLGFDIKGWQVTVPSWRIHDVFFEEDLIEEVARMYSYDKLVKHTLKTESLKLKSETNYQNIQTLKNFFSKQGFNEILTYSLVSKQETGEERIELEKSLSPETSYLRTSLLAGLIKTIAQNPWATDVNIFEIGRVFSDSEHEMLGIASTRKLPFDIVTQTITPDHALAKINKLRRTIYVTEIKIREAIKMFSQVLKIKNFELGINKIMYRPISNFPPAVRDIAVIIDSKVEAREIITSIKLIDNRILLVELFDEFKSNNFGDNKKSLAFHIVFDDPQKTMNEKEVSKLMDKISKIMQNKFAAKIR